MKNILLLVLISILPVNAYSQKKMTPRELGGFKGYVKSVKEEVTLLQLNEQKYNSSERLPSYECYFDKDGNVTQETEKLDSRYKLESIYDPEGRISEQRIFDETGFQSVLIKFKYNAKGQISERNVSSKGKYFINHYFTYDGEGNLIEERNYYTSESKSFQATKIYCYKDYKFDERGNWIQCTITMTAVLDDKTTTSVNIYYRTIEYYR